MSKNTEPNTISVGIAQADISPPVGTPSAGFAGRGPLTALHDPLYATALVLSDGKRTAALVACDLLYLDAETVNEIREEVEQKTDVAAEHLTIACTHTHYGPDATRERSDPRVSAYRANLVYALAGAVEEAASKMQPTHLGIGWGTSDIGVNRREKLPDGRVILGQNPAGPIDRAVGVLRIDTPDGQPILCLVNFQTHPVSQASQTSHISADYPGKACEIVESLIDAPCTFLQGASGNINASIMEPSYEPARTLGTRLGCEVVRVWETIRPQPIHGLRVATAHVDLPAIRYGSREKAADLVRSLEAEIERYSARQSGFAGAAGQPENASAGRLLWAKRRLDRAQRALESWTSGVLEEPIRAELQAWRIGEFALVTAPGEIFNEIGVQVKAGSPFDNTFFVSCANDSIGYVPVPEAYEDGGYEVTHASQVDPEGAAILTEGCLRLLRELRA
jgi:neutral ceramidase